MQALAHQLVEREKRKKGKDKPGSPPSYWYCTVCGFEWQGPDKPLSDCPASSSLRFQWGQAPAHLKTLKELRAAGLRPKQLDQPQGYIYYYKQESYIWLYNQAETVERPKANPKQLEALEKARLARRTCKVCKQAMGVVLYGQLCDECQLKATQTAVAAEAQVILTHPDQYLILDTETTSLYRPALVEIAVVSVTGVVVYHQRVKPPVPISEGAMEVHGISDEMLADCPTFDQIYPALAGLLQGKKVVAYNADFDAGVLSGECERCQLPLVEVEEWLCAMELYAMYCNDWSDYHRGYRWQPLPYGDHSAVGDSLGLLRLLEEVAETKE